MDPTRTRSKWFYFWFYFSLVQNPIYEDSQEDKFGGPPGKKQKVSMEQERVKKDNVSEKNVPSSFQPGGKKKNRKVSWEDCEEKMWGRDLTDSY